MTEPRDPNEPGWGAPQPPPPPWAGQQWGAGTGPGADPGADPGAGADQGPGVGPGAGPGPGGPPPGWGPPPPGYGQPPYGVPPQYGAPGNPYGTPGPYGGPAPYGYYGEPPTDGKAVGALVAAILSWLFCPIIPAVVALVLAGQSSRAIRASGGGLKGAGMNTAAKIIAWSNIVVFGLLIAIVVGFAFTSESTSYVEYGLGRAWNP